MPPDLSLSQVKITPRHLDRKAVIYIRQSSPKLVRYQTTSSTPESLSPSSQPPDMPTGVTMHPNGDRVILTGPIDGIYDDDMDGLVDEDGPPFYPQTLQALVDKKYLAGIPRDPTSLAATLAALLGAGRTAGA